MIYTSYFGNLKNILANSNDYVGLISIAGKTPHWFIGEKCHQLMPKYDWWKQWHDNFSSDLDSKESKAWYIDKYDATVLNKLDPNTMHNYIMDLCQGKIPILFCYETPEKFCHRHLVAEWFCKHGIECIEWKNDTANCCV